MKNHAIEIPVVKKDASQMLAFGFANVCVGKSGDTVTDLQSDQIPPEVLEKAAYNFVLKYRDAGVEHEVTGIGRLVESIFLTEEKLVAMGIKDDTYKGAAWWVGFKVDDPEVWKAVEKGDLAMFSIGGSGYYEEVEA